MRRDLGTGLADNRQKNTSRWQLFEVALLLRRVSRATLLVIARKPPIRDRSRMTPRGLGLSWLWVGAFAVSSCYRAEIDLTALSGKAPGGTTASSSGGAPSGAAGMSAGGAAGHDPNTAGGAAGSDAGGEGGVSAGAAGQSSTTVEPPCIDEQVTAEEEVCRQLGAPERAECSEQAADGWKGCYFGNCLVCSKSVIGYPYYFDWHPCCKVNDTCYSNDPMRCNSLCPAPTEREKSPPCFRVALTP
jgi:hypothetical protein